MIFLLFIAGLVFLIAGAELLVRGASKIAMGMKVSPLIIGLTVVAFGTGSPELAISINGVFSGQAGLAIGNVLGSNIFNILFVLGLSAIIAPLYISKQLIRLDIPLMIGFSVVLLLVGLDLTISRFDGVLLTSGLIAYIALLVYLGFLTRPDDSNNNEPEPDANLSMATSDSSSEEVNWLLNIVFVVAGLGILILGSRWLVDSAVTFATYLGVSELIIGLTIVAIGTSMPEIVTSLMAAAKGERDIAVGNIVGSNIFNILGVLGITSLVAPSGIPISEAVIGFDIPLMVVVALACLPIFFTGGTISRWEGALFLAYYIAYSLYLFFNATQHDMLPVFNYIMLYFAVPLTILTLIIVIVQEFYAKDTTSVPSS